ncbi:MAG: PolC-type DNA polymerase III, partial [Bacillota bacterium]|nr:PolC-type DNA polymerase III [Bacillota bacterium]
NKNTDAITEIGAVKVKSGEVIGSFSTFVNPKRHIPGNITDLTGITDEMVKDAPTEADAVRSFLAFVGKAPVIAHNAKFDTGFIKESVKRMGTEFNNPIICTLMLAKPLLPELKKHKLNIIAEHLNIENPNHHRAVNDAEVTASIWKDFTGRLKNLGVTDISKINKTLGSTVDVKKAKAYHVIILIKSFEGIKNLYKIISESHINYYHKYPRIPKSLLTKYRQGLIVGSACEAGELYGAIRDDRSEGEIEEIASFYDYLEIQPLKNNAFMIREGTVSSEADLIEINKKIVALGDKMKKLTVATCDTHFLDPEDEVFRRILMDSKGFQDADDQAPLYFRNTEEMLSEFTYLGEEKAYEIVVTNTNKIADMVEDLVPIKSGSYPPSIENSAQDLERLCYEKAHLIYGEEIPPFVKDRIEKELRPIIANGYDVMYMIAQKLVKKSNDDGYIVGSRGSVGSSFVAYLSGITEINSLPAHYICSDCKYLEFPEVEPGMSGCDLPDKICPNCGGKLNKDGHDIPFETFLGFNADKTPDIDLNFSGDYQTKAHKYTETLFGEGYVFKAGTIGTVAEKTAYGFVKKYFEKRNITVREAEVERLKLGCTGVKRTTGQHPGGIIVCPKNLDIHDFTPVQRPADDVDSDVTTTHFDYHSIHDNLLKLDILGHDDPTVIRMLEDLTGIKVQSISLDDKETMSLFSSTKALNVTTDEIGSEVGTFGIPEFGTRIVRNMLVETKPTSFSELVRISGLSHGTDVWFGNARDLVQSHTCSLNSCICTRDDIMAYLISKELPNGTAFKIMESVRKGKGLKEEWQTEMKEHGVPDWYIESCLKIKYMFPKAHAAAYVTNAFRIAWYKVHYPLEFYIAYFTVRADDFDYDLMTKGYDFTTEKIKEFERMGKDIGTKEKNILTILEMCREMYARGFDFAPVDLYKSDSVKFKKDDGRILPPLSSIAGLGGVAASQISDARQGGEFFSLDDLRQRAKVGKSVTEMLRNAGCLKGIPESSQMTFFDMEA